VWQKMRSYICCCQGYLSTGSFWKYLQNITSAHLSKPDSSLLPGSKHAHHVRNMDRRSTVLIVPVFDLACACRHEHLITYGTVTTISMGGTYRLLYPKVLKSLIFSCMIKMDLLVDLTMSAMHISSVASYCYLFTSHPLSTCEFLSPLLVALMIVRQVVSALLVNML
jgi:hypothetical protein